MRTRRYRMRGFTLIELMVTLALLAVLATVAVPLTQIAIKRKKEQELRTALADIRAAIDAYKRAAEQGRVTLKPGDSGYPDMLEQLVEGVDDQQDPSKNKMYFLRRIPADPMAPAGWGKRSYASPPESPFEGADVFDVYSTSEQTGLNGVPYRQW